MTEDEKGWTVVKVTDWQDTPEGSKMYLGEGDTLTVRRWRALYLRSENYIRQVIEYEIKETP